MACFVFKLILYRFYLDELHNVISSGSSLHTFGGHLPTKFESKDEESISKRIQQQFSPQMLETMSRILREYQDKLPAYLQPRPHKKVVTTSKSKNIIIINNNNNNNNNNSNIKNSGKLDNNGNTIINEINNKKINNIIISNDRNNSSLIYDRQHRQNAQNNNDFKVVRITEKDSTSNDTNILTTKQLSNMDPIVEDSLLSNNNTHREHNTNSYRVEKQRKTVWDDYPYTSEELGIMPVSKFNDSLCLLDEYRIHLARDIRRKFKNKIAARKCRKRKIQHIDRLDTGVDSLESRLSRAQRDNTTLKTDIDILHDKTKRISEHIFQQLRDTKGKRYSKQYFSLVFSREDKEVFLVPLNKKMVGRTTKYGKEES